VMAHVPELRVRATNDAPVHEAGGFVLYWMTAFRRVRWNFALDRAVDWSARLGKPLVVLEALRAGYPWASDRLHAFVLQGMADNARRLAATPVRYHPYVEPEAGHGRGLLGALAGHAAVVVTDDYPAFFHHRMLGAAASKVAVRLEAVDANGLLPLAASERAFPTAFAFRAFLQKSLRPHLSVFPSPDPAGLGTLREGPPLPEAITARWPAAPPALLEARPEALAALPIDHAVRPAPARGGAAAGDAVLARFLDERLARYHDERNQPEQEVTSGLSPYLHFGHVSAHQVFEALMTRERWTTRALGGRAAGKREGWWGTSAAAESFLDELVTWREVGFNMCAHGNDYDRYESLPAWARATLDAHAGDPRPHVYPLAGLEAARTHDPLWNAAQTQLLREGRIHSYLRMLWGKKILEWSSTPREALAAMIELNNKYALDGRDPNSYSGIFWVLGRYDRPWAPQRPIFGTVRYMSSENTARKLRVKDYVRRYTPDR